MNLAQELIDSIPEFNRLGIRRNGFSVAIDHILKSPDNMYIIETGTARIEDNWEGDGQSTLIWDKVINYKPSLRVVSIDLNQEAIDLAYAKTEKVQFIQGDSVEVLSRLDHDILSRTFFLYLDSFDWSEELNFESALHHLAELTAVYAALPKGAMIMIDDRHDDRLGKHFLVGHFFDKLSISPIYSGYQIAWIKNP